MSPTLQTEVREPQIIPSDKITEDTTAAFGFSTPETGSRWAELVRQVERGDASGMEELYRLFSKGIRLFLSRQPGVQDLDDRVHDTFVTVVQAIRRGDLREPDRLMGFVRTVVRRQVAAHIHKVVQMRRETEDVEIHNLTSDFSDPEQSAMKKQRDELVTTVLRDIPQRDREILIRFYYKEHTQEEICSQMNLNETQFRLLKSRAKARFGDLGRKMMNRRKIF